MSANYFSILTADVRYSKAINDGEKILFSEISSLTQKYGYCVASNGYFAKLYGLTKAAISKRISNLEKAGFIRCEIDGKNGNERKIFLVISPEKGYQRTGDTYQPQVETYQPQVETYQPQVETPINPECRPYQPGVDIYNNTSLSIQDLTENLTETPLPPQGECNADEKPAPKKSPNQNQEILTVFDFWKNRMGHPKARLDPKRKRYIAEALKWDYSADDLCQAITGCSLTPHNMGQNDRGQRYDGLHVVLKDADQIDRFMANAVNPPKALNKQQTLEQQNAKVLANYNAMKAQGQI